MLILTRKTSETIKISDDVEVVVLSVKGEKVRIGINAPQSVAVHRSEIYHQIKSQPDDANATSNNVCKWSIGSDKHK